MNNYGKVIIYKDKTGKDSIEVKLENNTVWLNLNELVKLYNSSKSNILEHIKHIFEDGELNNNLVVRKFRTTANDGKLYNVKYYNLDMIVAIGFRVRSNVGTNFRIWANERLTEYMKKGFTMNDELLKQAGGGLYFDELLSRIRDIRSSEKVFWRKILDIYATSIDYDPRAKITQKIFKTVQNKMHWAVHGHTAAEIILERAKSEDDFMGLKTFKGDYPTLLDATTAKNYLNECEIKNLNNLVNLFLDIAENNAERNIPMYTYDWKKIENAIKLFHYELLEDNLKNLT